MFVSINFGEKIINYRRKNHITIKELAKRTNLSTAIISQLERGLGNPTLKVLSDLADELGVTLSELLREDIKNEALILRKEERIVSYYADGGVETMSNLLVDSPLHTSLDVQMLTLTPHRETRDGFMSHLEEESLYVLEGQVVIVFSEEEEYLLRTGDSVRIMPGRLHKLRNDYEQVAVCINMKCKVNY